MRHRERERETSSVVKNYETEIHIAIAAKVISPCNANRNDHAGEF